MNKEKKQLIPELRFPEFEKKGIWKKTVIGSFIRETQITADKSLPLFSLTIEEGVVPKSKRYQRSFLVKDKLDAYKVVSQNDFVYNPMNLRFGAIAKYDGNEQVAVSKYYNVFHCEDFVDSNFCELFFKSYPMITYYNNVATGSLIEKRRVHFSDFLKFNIPIPKFDEQQKIAKCLSSLENLISSETEKLKLIKDHKKGLLQQLFPSKGETKPQFRFPEFKNDGDWVECTLEKCLDYLQPSKYLVYNTDYQDKFETPVLTAGKTFILGYTDEKEGIFSKKLPIIIFDDFTTATKFVDFPFKVKSSAIKILLPKADNNIQFLYETIQNLNFEVSTHKRHWISVYSKLIVLVPKDPKEQQKIADCFSNVNDLIEAQEHTITNLQDHKKGLMQQLFPDLNSL